MKFGLRSCHLVIRNAQWKIMAQRPTLYLFYFIYVLCSNLFPQSAIANPQLKPEQLFQAGIYAEEIKGELQEALKFYQQIVRDFPDDRPIAAKAQLHLGLCYEKLGQPKAAEAYQKVLENYPDQREIATMARKHLNRLKASAIRNPNSEISPLVKYYFERFGINITSSTSYDGKYLAYTDWTTGSLMIADLGVRNAENNLRKPQSASHHENVRNPKFPIRNQDSETKIVAADLSRSPEYACYPAWSRDGKYIAYSWYRAPYFAELRAVTVADGKIEVLHSDSQLMINPDDWSPDGKTIVCETLNFAREHPKHLALVRVETKELQDVLPLVDDTRRLHFSPDGKYLAYNLTRHDRIFLLALEDLRQADIPAELPGVVGYDGPIWSPDGKLILCRNVGTYDLWATPMQDGKPVGKPYPVQSDLSKAMLSLKSMASPSNRMKQPMHKNTVFRKTPIVAQSFAEEFTSSVFDPAWSVFEWKGQNVHDYTHFNHYSLASHPGHLRYYLDPISDQAHSQNYLPHFNGWYWLYPSLEISRPLYGDHWLLEAKVTYSLIDGANGRGFALLIFFEPVRDPGTALLIQRSKDINPASNKLLATLRDRGATKTENAACRSPRDTFGVSQFTYIYRITRADTLIQVELSDDDGKNFQQVFSASLRPELRGVPQLLALTGNSWFVPAGAYADWDYIRFRIAEEVNRE